MTDNKNAMKIKPLLIAHRGDTMSYPENTLEAFLSAFEKGADGVEMDVQLYNGEIIVVHNYLFDRNVVFPKFEDILSSISQKGRIEVEIKAFDTKILSKLKPILDSYPLSDLELTTSEIPLSSYIKAAFPKIPFGLILHNFYFEDWMTEEVVQNKIIGWGKLTKADRIHISYKALNQYGKGNLVKELHRAGFLVHSHIFHTDDEIIHLSDLTEWGVDQCTFDNIELVYSKNKI